MKPENILLNHEGHVKLADFGLSKQLRRGDDYSTTFCGSPEYLCPEMLLGNPHNKTMDYYTLGCLLYEMICSFPPFYCHDQNEIRESIKFREVEFPIHVSDPCQDLIKWLLQKDPSKRPQTWAEIRSHPFFKGINFKRVQRQMYTPPWIPNVNMSNYNPKFTSLNVPEEMKAMGLDESRKSFYYEKVKGRQEGKSVYKLTKTEHYSIDEEFDLANGKMYIKNWDFSDLPL